VTGQNFRLERNLRPSVPGFLPVHAVASLIRDLPHGLDNVDSHAFKHQRLTSPGPAQTAASLCRYGGQVFAELGYKRVISVAVMQKPVEILSPAEKVGHGLGVEFVSRLSEIYRAF